MKEWDLFLKTLDIHQNGGPEQTWTSGYQITRFDAQNLYLKFLDVFSYQFFKEHVYPFLKNFKNSNDHPIKVHIDFLNPKAPLAPDKKTPNQQFNFTEPSSYDFSDFVVDPSNELLISLLKRLDDKPTTFNPFFIYGAKGSGKTHLLSSAFKFYKSKGLRCLYVSSLKFSEHVVYAMKQSLMTEFRQAYRHIDLLIFDDIQFLSGKVATQEEFFHTFNSLHMTGKLILLSAHRPPSELSGIEQRLISRFEWGLSLELNPLSSHGINELLNVQEKKLGLNLKEKDKQSLIENCKSDSSKLVSALQAITLRTHLADNKQPSIVAEALEELKEQTKALTLDDITVSCAKFFKLKTKDLKGSGQARHLAFPRQMTMYLIRKLLTLPYKKIGEYLDRDHSTVMASVTLIEDKIKKLDEETLNAIKRIEWDLKQN